MLSFVSYLLESKSNVVPINDHLLYTLMNIITKATDDDTIALQCDPTSLKSIILCFMQIAIFICLLFP